MNINKLNKAYEKTGWVLIKEFFPIRLCKIVNIDFKILQILETGKR